MTRIRFHLSSRLPLPGLAVLLALMASCGSEPLRLFADDAEVDAVEVIPHEARREQGERGLEIRGSYARVRFRLPNLRADLTQHPVLHLRLRNGRIDPIPLTGRITVVRNREDSAPVRTFHGGSWTAAGSVDLWLDLTHDPEQVVFDRLAGRVDELQIDIEAPPELFYLECVELHPPGLRAWAAVTWRRFSSPHRAAPLPFPVWLALIVILGVVWTTAGLLRAAWPLGRPTSDLAPPLARRFVQLLPSRLVLATLVVWAWQASGSVHDLVRDVGLQWQRTGRLDAREHWLRHAQQLDPDLPELLRALKAKVPPDGEIGLRGTDDEAIINLARYLLFPRLVDRSPDAPYLAHLGRRDLPRLAQPKRGRWARLTPDSPVGQLYEVPGPSRDILELEAFARPGTLQPGERLAAELFATRVGRKVHARAEARGRTVFRFDPPERLAHAETFFRIRHVKGGDGRVELAAGRAKWHRKGSLLATGSQPGEDLTFGLYFVPEGYSLIRFAGDRSSLFKRSDL